MSCDQKSGFCLRCRQLTLHARNRTSETMGCLLTVLTGGLFLPIWLAMSFFATIKGYRCQQCGTRSRGFFSP